MNELANNSGAIAVYKAGVQALTNSLNSFSGASLIDEIRNITILGERLNVIKKGEPSWFENHFGTKDQWRIVQEESEKLYLAQSRLSHRLATASSSELRDSIDALDKSLAPLYDKYANQKKRYGIKGTDNINEEFLSTRGGSQYYTAISRGLEIRKQLALAFYAAVENEKDATTGMQSATQKSRELLLSMQKWWNEKGGLSKRESSVPEKLRKAIEAAKEELNASYTATKTDYTKDNVERIDAAQTTYNKLIEMQSWFYNVFDRKHEKSADAYLRNLKRRNADEIDEINNRWDAELEMAEQYHTTQPDKYAQMLKEIDRLRQDDLKKYNDFITKKEISAESFLASIKEKYDDSFTSQRSKINQYYDSLLARAKKYASDNIESYKEMVDKIKALRDKDLSEQYQVGGNDYSSGGITRGAYAAVSSFSDDYYNNL